MIHSQDTEMVVRGYTFWKHPSKNEWKLKRPLHTSIGQVVYRLFYSEHQWQGYSLINDQGGVVTLVFNSPEMFVSVLDD